MHASAFNTAKRSSPIFVNTEQESERALLQVVKRLGDDCEGCHRRDPCDGFAVRELPAYQGIYNIHICIYSYLLSHHIAKIRDTPRSLLSSIWTQLDKQRKLHNNHGNHAQCSMHHAPCSTRRRSARSELQVCRHIRCSFDNVGVVTAPLMLLSRLLSSPC
jgi:hypothetical protein